MHLFRIQFYCSIWSLSFGKYLILIVYLVSTVYYRKKYETYSTLRGDSSRITVQWNDVRDAPLMSIFLDWASIYTEATWHVTADYVSLFEKMVKQLSYSAKLIFLQRTLMYKCKLETDPISTLIKKFKKLKVFIDWNLRGIINDQFKNILLIQGRDM